MQRSPGAFRRRMLTAVLFAAFALLASTGATSNYSGGASAQGAVVSLADDQLDLDVLGDDSGSADDGDSLADVDANDAASDETPAPSSPGGSSRATLVDLILASGWIGVILLLCSVAGAALVIRLCFQLRRSVFIPSTAERELSKLIAEGRNSDALAVAEASDSFLARVAAAGLHETDRGWSATEKALEDAYAEESVKLYRRTEPLSLIGNVAPMLGLLGTVVGMVSTFGEIAVADGSGRNLANGIYFALVTTVDGLIVAIPALVAHALLNSKIASLISDAGVSLEKIFRPMKHGVAGNPPETPVEKPTAVQTAAPVRSGLREVSTSPAQPASAPAPQPAQRPTLELRRRQPGDSGSQQPPSSKQ